MVSSTARKIFSFAISLLVAVISLTTAAQAATVPTVSVLTRYTQGFAGTPGKMARDAAGNFYVTDFWGKGIVKLNRQGSKVGFIATNGRPSAVAVLKNNKLVVAVAAPQPKIAFYNQLGSAPNITGEEDTVNLFGTPATPYFRPVAITLDGSENIYVLDSGDSNNSLTTNVAKVVIYNNAGSYLGAFGSRNANGTAEISTVGGQFMQPMGIAYEKAANQIVVADTMNNRLQFFTANGASSSYVTSLGVSFTDIPNSGSSFQLGDPVDVAFEYTNAGVLDRIYVAEKARHEVAVADAVSLLPLRRITAATNQTYATPVAGADMRFPSGIIFEKTGTTSGVLYTSNASTSLTSNNILALGIDGGAIPGSGVTLAITSSVPATVTSSPLLVSGTTSPANSVSCSVNGGADVVASGASSWSVSLNLNLNAQNYILCKATSGSTTSYADARTYYAGTLQAAPTVSITSPAAGLYTKNPTVTVSGIADTANATVRLTNALNNLTVDTTTAADKSWSAVVTLAEGGNAITPTIWRAGTAIGSGAAATVVADYTAPSATIAFLSDTKVTGSAVQNLDGIVLDANLQSVVVNGDTVSSAAMVTMAGNNTYFSMPVTLIRGSNTVTIKATDRAGNSSTVTRIVTLDPDVPAFTVDLPAGNSYLPGSPSTAANGTADASYTSVNAAGLAVSPAAGAWSAAAFTLSAGIKAYEYTASGAKIATEKRTIINDAAYAQLAITSPAADKATNSASVLIQGSVAPLSAIPTITVDGGATVNVTTYDSNTGNFSHTVTLVSQGAHTVKVSANAATSAVRNIIYDTIAPDLTIQADSKPAPIIISGAIEPSAKISAITASLLGTPVAIPLSVLSYAPYDAATDSVVWHATLSGYAYDTISFTAVDPAGNTSQLAYSAVVPTGDVDGDGSIRLADALTALRHVAGTQALIGNPFVQADVGALVENRAGRDGKVDITDATLILKKSYGLLSF